MRIRARFDPVIADITIPETTGVDRAREMFAIRAGVPTIMSSGHSCCVGADDGKAAGIQGFVVKPPGEKGDRRDHTDATGG